jgi:hypothetical protein
MSKVEFRIAGKDFAIDADDESALDSALFEIEAAAAAVDLRLLEIAEEEIAEENDDDWEDEDDYV